MKTNNKKTSTVYKLLSASFAFVIWGGWAYFVNSSDNLRTSLTAGLTQGTASFIITLIMVYFISIIYNILPSNLATLLKTLLPAMITISITGTGLILNALNDGNVKHCKNNRTGTQRCFFVQPFYGL